MSRKDPVVIRWWRLRPWSPNPLMRGSDRIETVAVIFIVAAMMLLVPIAGAIGTVSYAQLTERSHQAITGAQQVPALVVDNDAGAMPVRDPVSETSTGLAPVLARWEAAGTEHTGRVRLETRAEAGETVLIWVDEDGKYRPAPRTGTENAIAALGTALAFLVLGTAGCALVLFGLHWVMNRHRIVRWQQEWQQVRRSPGWHIG